MQNISMTSKSPIDSFVLKVVAIVAMTCNHIANVYSSVLPLWAYTLMIGIGGLTFPIMAYLMLIGYKYTRNVWKYFGRLVLFAVIAQVPYTFMIARPNVLFTLAIGLFLYWLYDNISSKGLFWFTAVLIILATAMFDWGLFGPLCMVLFKVFDKYDKWWSIVLPLTLIGIIHILFGYGGAVTGTEDGLSAIGTGAVAVWQGLLGQGFPPIVNAGNYSIMLYGAMNIVAGTILVAYNGQRGLPMKYFFYVYYPLHLAVIVGIAYLLGVK